MNVDNPRWKGTIRPSRHLVVAMSADKAHPYNEDAKSLLRSLMLFQLVLSHAGASFEQEERFFVDVGDDGIPLFRMHPMTADEAHEFVERTFARFPREVKGAVADLMKREIEAPRREVNEDD
jgi:hypothetical protein